MSRITGNDAKGLMEAYGAVYTPQELTEEQVWEEVETWVNSLLEEGYDLSDYTWEEMYESYLEEQGRGTRTGSNPNVYKSPAQQKPQVAGGGMGGMRGSGRNRTATQTSSSPGALRVPSPAPKPPTATPPTATPPPKPPTATPPPKPPTATPPPKPPTGSLGGDTKLNPTPPATATPTPAPSASPARPSLSSQADEIRKMRAGSLARQGKTLESSTVSGTTKPAYQANSFDPFDVVKGHLIDEGYADTEEAALKIMANMSESWKNSIIG
jgi:outer membrane biosynthesis protein TonB